MNSDVIIDQSLSKTDSVSFNRLVVDSTITIGGITLPNKDGTAGQVLTTDGAGALSFTTVSGGGGLSNVVEDTTPQLGGALDTNGNNITFSRNLNIVCSWIPEHINHCSFHKIKWFNFFV